MEFSDRIGGEEYTWMEYEGKCSFQTGLEVRNTQDWSMEENGVFGEDWRRGIDNVGVWRRVAFSDSMGRSSTYVDMKCKGYWIII